MFTNNQIEEFLENGYLLISDLFKPNEIEALSNEVSVLNSQDSPNVYKQDGDDDIRTVFATNQFSKLFERAYKLDFLIKSVKKLLKDEVYLFQYKFNTKNALKQGSHKLGRVACTMENPDGVHDENLKYVIHKEALEEAVEKCGGMVSTKGKKGSVLFFDSNVLHASSQNLYFKNRDILMITYNSVSNAVQKISNPRENFMVGRDFSPIKSIKTLLK